MFLFGPYLHTGRYYLLLLPLVRRHVRRQGAQVSHTTLFLSCFFSSFFLLLSLVLSSLSFFQRGSVPSEASARPEGCSIHRRSTHDVRAHALSVVPVRFSIDFSVHHLFVLCVLLSLSYLACSLLSQCYGCPWSHRKQHGRAKCVHSLLLHLVFFFSDSSSNSFLAVLFFM